MNKKLEQIALLGGFGLLSLGSAGCLSSGSFARNEAHQDSAVEEVAHIPPFVHPFLAQLKDIRGTARDGTPLADYVLTPDEFAQARGETSGSAALISLTSEQKAAIQESYAVLARDAKFATAGDAVPQAVLDQIHGTVAWQLQRTVAEHDGAEKFYLVARLADDLTTGTDASAPVARAAGTNLFRNDGSPLMLEMSKEQLAALGYDVPDRRVVARVEDTLTNETILAPAVRTTLTNVELAEGIEDRVALFGDKVWFTPEQEQTYGALHTLLGPGEAAFRQEISDAGVQDAHYSLDEERVYVRGKNAAGETVNIQADLWARSAESPAAARLTELKNAIRLHGDAAASSDYAARREAGRTALDAEAARVRTAATQATDLEARFYSVGDLKAQAQALPADDDAQRAQKESALRAVTALEMFSDPARDPYLGGLLRDNTGATIQVHLYKPSSGARMPFYEFRVVGSDGARLGTTTRTLGDGLQFGEAVDYLVGKIAEREAADTKEQ